MLIFSSFLLSSCGGGASTDSTSPPPVSTTWTDRIESVNGASVVYKFGEGNPSAVSLNSQDYTATQNSPGVPYVTGEVETNLVQLLSSLELKELIQQCSKKNQTYDLAIEYPNGFDVNDWLVVNQSSKRKEIKNLSTFSEWLNRLRPFEEDFNSTRLAICFEGDEVRARRVLRALNNKIGMINSVYLNLVAE